MAVDLEDAIVKAAICVFIYLCYVEITLYESQAQPLNREKRVFRGGQAEGEGRTEEKGMRIRRKEQGLRG